MNGHMLIIIVTSKMNLSYAHDLVTLRVVHGDLNKLPRWSLCDKWLTLDRHDGEILP